MSLAYDDAYGTLNEAQRKAVDTIEGPVMVVAGPGTGKTQVLALRTATILRRTQARPSNILCLTFSTAGATAMRERLRRIIGADAYGVTVDTVHGFCDGLIRRHGTLFAEWSEMRPISDLERYKLFCTIIDETQGIDALINPKHPYDRIPDIISRISDCKREGKTLEDLKKVAELYDQEMAGKSREGTKAHRGNLRRAQAFRDFIRLAEAYEEAMREREQYDYDDMILTVLRALNEEEWLRASIQERYQYLLVDEAQDLNGAQWAVIERITTYDAVPHDPNLFVVGDDDQSVYRFQGANMAHMLSFTQRFPHAPVIVLTQNYRSTQAILDAAGRLIAQNEERLIGSLPGLTKDLVAMTQEPGAGEPLLLRPPSDTAERWLIADLCEDRLAAGVPPSEIAVLVQTNRELFPLYDVLRARGIPVLMQGKSDLCTHPRVLQALTILRSIADESDEAFMHAAACACFGCHPADLSRIVRIAKERRIAQADVWLELEQSADDAFAHVDALITTRDTLLDLRFKHASRTLLQTTEQVLRMGGLIPQDASADPMDLAAIETFFLHMKEYCLEHPTASIHAYLHDAGLYADQSLSQIRLTFQVPHLVSEGVQLLTAHQSKGLEFTTVMLAQFREGHWDGRKPQTKLSLPEELLFGWEGEQKRFEKQQDERRVAYVAMTRAKRELLLLCPKEFSVGERNRAVSPSVFFAEAGPLPESDAALKQPEEASLLLLHPPRDMDAEHRAYLLSRLEHFALSATSLDAFLRDPQECMRIHLLGMPEELTDTSMRAIAYGNAVHAALRAWAVQQQQQGSMDEAAFLSAFEDHLQQRTVLTQKQRSALSALGRETLSAYYAAHMADTHPIIAATERAYATTIAQDKADTAEGIPIRGKIDRIDLLSPTSADAIVIDYKTGAPKAPSALRGTASEGGVSHVGGDGTYFRQLVFYALLLEQAEPLLHPVSYVVQFIGEREHEPIARPFEIGESEKQDLRQLIRAVWSKIQALDFTPL